MREILASVISMPKNIQEGRRRKKTNLSQANSKFLFYKRRNESWLLAKNYILTSSDNVSNIISTFFQNKIVG